MIEADPDYERNKFRLQVAMEARRFEIDLLWRRSLFFWGFIAAALGAVVWSYGTRPRLAIVFSCFGFVSSALWTLVNRGSRFWHVSWESKVEAVEDQVIGPMFKTQQFSPSKNWWPGARYSPSRLVIAFSDYVSFLWCLFLAYQVTETLGRSWPVSWRDGFVLAFVGLSIGWLLVVKSQTRRHDA